MALAMAGAAMAVAGVAAAPGVGATARERYVVRVQTFPANRRIVGTERARGTPIVRVYRHVFPGFSGLLTRADRRRIARYPAVVGIARDRPVVLAQAEVRTATGTGLWGLDRIDQRSLPLDGRIITPSIGSGARVYVVDSGIRSAQEGFANRILPGISLVGDGGGTQDCNGHGTRVAGVIAGQVTGVAPGALLVPVRVIDCAGNGTSADVIAGLDWVVGHHAAGQPAVANVSLVGPINALVNAAILGVTGDGVTVTTAAGNQAQDACAASPASAPSAITVAAMTQDDAQAPFSGFGPCVSLFAPGDSVLTTATTGTRRTGNQLVFAGGTSISSAFAAGAAAVELSQFPFLSAAQVKDHLIASATAGALTGVTPGTPNRLLYVGTNSPPPVLAPPPVIPASRVMSGLRAQFRVLRPARPRVGRYRLTGSTRLAGAFTVTRAGRLLVRRRVSAGTFAVGTRAAWRIGVLRFQLIPDDPTLPVASAMVRVRATR